LLLVDRRNDHQAISERIARRVGQRSGNLGRLVGDRDLDTGHVLLARNLDWEFQQVPARERR